MISNKRNRMLLTLVSPLVNAIRLHKYRVEKITKLIPEKIQSLQGLDSLQSRFWTFLQIFLTLQSCRSSINLTLKTYLVANYKLQTIFFILFNMKITIENVWIWNERNWAFAKNLDFLNTHIFATRFRRPLIFQTINSDEIV